MTTKTKHKPKRTMLTKQCRHCGSVNLPQLCECYWCHQSLHDSTEREISAKSIAGKELARMAKHG